MLLPARLVGEEAGAFERDLDPEGLVRQVRRVAFGRDLDPLAVDDHHVALGADFAGPFAVDAVALEQQGIGGCVGQIVDRHQLEPVIVAAQDGARDEPADATETIDCNLGHLPNFSRIFGTIASVVRPKYSYRSGAGADAPKRSRPMRRPCRPV